MKKILLLIAIAITSLNTLNAQTAEHLTFQGIPINGSMSELVKKMQDKGFTHIESYNTFVLMQGIFTMQHCKIIIAATQKDQVYTIMVCTPSSDSWKDLKSSYNGYKNLYTTKYGNPDESQETFISPYRDGQGSELLAISSGNCSYRSAWNVEDGQIVLGIIEDTEDYTNSMISIAYIDNINSRLAQAEILDEI